MIHIFSMTKEVMIHDLFNKSEGGLVPDNIADI